MRRRKKRLTRSEAERHKILVSFGVVVIICIMSIGYAAFNTLISINVSGTAKRTDYYVSNGGSDENGDGTLDNPYLTIQKAYNEAKKVGTIYIMNDISQSTTINMDEEKKITLTSYSTNNTVHSVIKTAAINDYMVNQTKGTLNLKNITLDGNEIEDTKGCFHLKNCIFNANENTMIKDFISSSSGGGIFGDNDSVITLDGCTIENNVTGSHGGGVRTYYNNITIKGETKIINNRCGESGGGIFMGADTIAIVENVLIQGNTNIGSDAGAGITVYNGASLTFNNGTISNNISNGGGGGGIRVDTATLIMNGGTINGNNGNTSGSGIQCYGASFLTLNGGIVSNNTATTSNGGIGKTSACTYTNVNNRAIICENTPSNLYETHTTCPS